MPLEKRNGIITSIKLTVYKMRTNLNWYNKACSFLANLENSLHRMDPDDFGSAVNYWQELLLPEVMKG